MTDPESALAQARLAAETMRASGAYGDESGGTEPEEVGAQIESLLEWALIEPDLDDVRSTRRFGAPMTLFKRALLRMLAQYNGQLIANQTRFNVHLLGHLRRLQNRVEELESERKRNPE